MGSWGQTRAHSRMEMGGVDDRSKERANDNKDLPLPTM